MSSAPFIDWITVRQRFTLEEPLPLLFRGIHSFHTSEGVCVSERLVAQRVSGSWNTSIVVQCDGASVLLSGNVGRFGRADNVFNRDWRGTLEALDRVCDALALPRFRSVKGLQCETSTGQRDGGAIVSTLDITKNYSCGSEPQALAFIRYCSGLNVSRCKRGVGGQESVWWVNSRRMVKVYIKWLEMVAHGADMQDPLVVWCRDNGIVRVEVSLKRRLLSDLGLSDLSAISEEKLATIYAEETAFLAKFDSSDEPDILARIPARSRAYAAAWLAGQDLSHYCSRATLYRHGRVLREYGLDIFSPRNVQNFPTRVRVIDLAQVDPPSWYEWEREEVA